jgi:hypothetical protein
MGIAVRQWMATNCVKFFMKQTQLLTTLSVAMPVTPLAFFSHATLASHFDADFVEPT